MKTILARPSVRIAALCLILYAIGGVVQAQVAAPANLAGTMWIYQSSNSATQFLSTVTLYTTNSSSTVIFSQTTEIVSASPTVNSPTYQALSNSTYTYSGQGNVGLFSVNLGEFGTGLAPYVFETASMAYEALPTNYLGPNPTLATPLSSATVLRSVPAVGGANISSNAYVAPGQPATVGFIVSGTPRLVLLRVVGAGLQSFGVTEPLLLPAVTLYSNSQPVNLASPALNLAGPWRPDGVVNATGSNVTGYQYIFGIAGAFPLTPGAGDWADLALLAPGAYTLVASAPAGTQGQALCEVYFLPYAE
jgi:hypothetical protein